MKVRARSRKGNSILNFTSALFPGAPPSTSRISYLPVAFTQATGTPPCPGASESKSSLYGAGGTTRIRDLAVSEPALASTSPAVSLLSAGAEYLPSTTVPVSLLGTAACGAGTGFGAGFTVQVA